MRIIFLGTPLFAKIQLQALLENKFNIVAVYTQPDRPSGRGQKIQQSPVKQLAIDFELPVLQPTSFKASQDQELLASFKPDLIIVSAYGLILPKFVLELPTYGCWNVHASILPKWRGASPIQMSILKGDTVTGVTIMQMDEGLDTGDILKTKAISISQTDTSETLHNKLAILGAECLIETLNAKINNTLQPPIKQDERLATYAPKIKKEQGKIDWHLPSREINQLIRAFTPWPGAYTSLLGTVFKIHATTILPDVQNPNTRPGTIVSASKEGLDVCTTNGILRITQLQFPGKRPMPFHEILNAKRDLFIPGKQFE